MFIFSCFPLTFCCLLFFRTVFFTISGPDSTARLPTSVTSTATGEFGWLNSIPYSFFFVSNRSLTIRSYSFSVIFLLLLGGDVELNPGPISNNFVVCTLTEINL